MRVREIVNALQEALEHPAYENLDVDHLEFVDLHNGHPTVLIHTYPAKQEIAVSVTA